MTDLAARLLYVLAAAVARLPWRLLRAAADLVSSLQARGQGRMGKVVRRNLELAYPEMLPAQRM